MTDDDVKLPEPEVHDAAGYRRAYTAEQMREYAAAVAAEAVEREKERCARLAIDAAAAAVKKYEDDLAPVRQPYANNRLMHVGWAAADAIRGTNAKPSRPNGPQEMQR